MINRGNYRRRLFEGKGAADAFERVLGEAAERYGWLLHAYVVMGNHFHLGIELREPNLSEGMKWLQGTWIRRYNRFRKLVGRPFQGRYKALLVEPGHCFGQVCHYIHLNPVRAGLVKADHATDYKWSSLPKFVSRERPQWLSPGTVLGELTDTKRGWKKYLDYLEFLATDDVASQELISQKMSRGWCLGGLEFKDYVRREARERGAELDRMRFAGLEMEALRAEREAYWEETLQHAAILAKIDLNKLSGAKSAVEKCLLASVMKHRTSVSNAWLAKRLEMGQPASASQFARRWMSEEVRAKNVYAIINRLQ